MSLYNIEIKSMNGTSKLLKEYEGNVLLIVNTASKCGFTKQFEDLEILYKKHKDDGFKILGFPSNQFLHQDPGTNKEILDFCTLNYGVSFEMFEKIAVKGKEQHPLYAYLVANNKELPNKKIKWNFEKFLIAKDGSIFKRYLSNVKPFEIEEDIIQLLKKV